MNEHYHTEDDEIDIKEIFLALWRYKYIIIITCVCGIIYSGNLAGNAEKSYTSSAIFQSNQTKSKAINFGEELGALAGLSNGSIGGNTKPVIVKRYRSRVFIERLSEELDFETDTYFNKYKPIVSGGPLWKTIIKRVLNFKSVTLDPSEAKWQGIVKKYQKNVFIKIAKDDTITISVTHENAERAAIISNRIMNFIITDKKEKNQKEKDDQLEYLSTALADSLNDLEVTQDKLKSFAIENSALPLESFAIGSIALDSLREELDRTITLYDAASGLALVLEKKAVNADDYLSLRNKYPIIDQVEFRRVLGQSEIISSWSWPEKSSVNAIIDTLYERKKRLQSEIDTSLKYAEQSGKALEVYGKLKRNEKIAEATYKVLIEQVKSQSMTAGFIPDNTVIFEYAYPTIYPSAPRKSLYLMIGLIVGFLFGFVIIMLITLKNRVYHSRDAMQADVRAQFVANINPLLNYNKKKLSVSKNIINKKAQLILRRLIVDIHRSSCKFVIISSANTKFKSNDLAHLISRYLIDSKINIAVIDFSSDGMKPSVDKETDKFGDYQICNVNKNINFLKPTNHSMPIDFLNQANFSEELQSLNKSFDLIFVCGDDNDSISLARAVNFKEVFHILLARTKYSKRQLLLEIKKSKPIQGLMYV
jgi:uncharacterized protein involved in exopolysaccharide biosynthesis